MHHPGSAPGDVPRLRCRAAGGADLGAGRDSTSPGALPGWCIRWYTQMQAFLCSFVPPFAVIRQSKHFTLTTPHHAPLLLSPFPADLPKPKPQLSLSADRAHVVAPTVPMPRRVVGNRLPLPTGDADNPRRRTATDHAAGPMPLPAQGSASSAHLLPFAAHFRPQSRQITAPARTTARC